MKPDQRPEGGKATTKVVVLVERPDGTSQVVNFVRDTPLPLNFSLNDCRRISSKEHDKVPGRIKFFFDRFGRSVEEEEMAKTQQGAEEGEGND